MMYAATERNSILPKRTPLASALHPLQHAQDRDLIAFGLLEAGCTTREVRAFEAQARTWRVLWTGDRPSSIASRLLAPVLIVSVLLLGVPDPTLAQACSPGPPVSQQARPINGDRLSVALSAGSGNLQSVLFHVPGDAVLIVPGGPIPGVGDFTVSPNATQLTFDLLRRSDGVPSTVRLTITDGCGSWPTFVDGGTPRWGNLDPAQTFGRWTIRPNVTLAAAPDGNQSNRFQGARDAISFWNDQFSALTSSFRVGTVQASIRFNTSPLCRR